jgi:hypothetical protein
VLQSKPSKFAVRTATWRMSVQMALAGTAAAVALMAGLAVCRADQLDTSLIGAWAASAADCARLFQTRGGAPAFRQPVDKFAQAAIITPQQIVTPSSTSRLRRVSHGNGVIKVDADCNDSISYATETAQITIRSAGEIVYSSTGDTALDTTLIRCRL